MEQTSFDTRAFLFTVKVFAFVILLALGVRFGAEMVFVNLYVDKVEASVHKEIIQNQKPIVPQKEEKKEAQRALAVLADKNQILESRVIEGKSVSEMVAEEGKFIAADLKLMQISLYENGELLKTLPIISKGRPGSYWETPTGRYEVMTKEDSHFSSFGGVYMPYSMQFFGNFFIHGWPYYPDGTAVGAGYSGGCIRLSTEDSKEVYDFADRATPIIVYNEFDKDEFLDTVRVKNEPLPKLSAEAFIVADVHTGRVYTERNSDKRLPVASITKLMTAVVASETINFENIISVDTTIPNETANDYGTIEKGDSFKALSLVYPLLMESNNAIAHSFADMYGNRAFVEWMNKKSKAIGAMDTIFTDPSGISSGNRSTVSDLFLISQYLLENRSFILSVSKTPRKIFTAENGSVYSFENHNPFAEEPTFKGGKTGYTNAAKETMLSIFEVPLTQGTSTVSIIVLGSSDREGDTVKLREWFKRAVVE